jgi:hypothetical protein
VFVPAQRDPAWEPSRQPASAGRASQPRRGLPARPLTAVTLILICIAAVAFVAIPRNPVIRIRPADNPEAAASQPALGVTAGAGTPSLVPPAITRDEAEQVLASYWQVNSRANILRSSTLLGTIEAGTSYRMDTGTYQAERAEDPGSSRYTAFTASDAVYYIPRQPAGVYPRWFAVRVTYVTAAAPSRVTGTGYVLFTQPAAGSPWKNVLEPYILPHAGPPPFIQTDAQGYAITPAAAAGELSVAPDQIQQETIASLNGTATVVKNPGNLADLTAQAYFESKLPAGSADTDTRTVPGMFFALSTVNGGALVFYSLGADLSLAPPAGSTFELAIPGFYSLAQALTSAHIGYAEQFATCIPQQGSPQVIADASGITGRS